MSKILFEDLLDGAQDSIAVDYDRHVGDSDATEYMQLPKVVTTTMRPNASSRRLKSLIADTGAKVRNALRKFRGTAIALDSIASSLPVIHGYDPSSHHFTFDYHPSSNEYTLLFTARPHPDSYISTPHVIAIGRGHSAQEALRNLAEFSFIEEESENV